MEDVYKFIANDYQTPISSKWNEERKKIGSLCMNQYVFPAMTKYVKEKLANDATDFVAKECQVALMKVN